MSKKEIQSQINAIIRQYLEDDPGCNFRHYCDICSPDQKKKYCFFTDKRIESQLREDILCTTCISFSDCLNAINGELIPYSIPSFQNHLVSLRNVTNPLKTFNQGYYPVIDGDSPKIIKHLVELVKEQKVQGIVFNPSKNMSIKQYNLLQPGSNKSLHEMLNYKDEIILRTNFDDKFCDLILKDPNRFREMINVLEPDCVMSIDANFYIDQPNFITAIQLDKVFKGNDTIFDLKQKMIGLVPPAMFPFFEIGLLTQLSIGHKTIAIPLHQMNAKKTTEYSRFIKQILRRVLTFQKKFNFEFMLLSTSPQKYVNADSYASFTWAMIKKNGAGKEAELTKKDLQTKRLKRYIRKAKENIEQKRNKFKFSNRT